MAGTTRTFKVLWWFDAAIALVALYFLGVGLNDGSVSADNAGLWLMIVAGLAAILGGGLWLAHAGQRAAAVALLLVLAIPGALYLAFLLLILVTQPRWN